MPERVLLTDAISASGEALLAQAVEVVRAPASDADTLRRLARDADAVIVRSRLPEDIFAAAPRLRAVTIHGTGTDLVPLAAATALGVPVARLPGGNAQSVAEYCLMAMLLLARNALPVIAAWRGGDWESAHAQARGAHEIAAMTAGIVGVGEIGGRLARMLKNGLGMRVLGHRRRAELLPGEATPAGLDALLGESDFVVLACPLTPETHHMIGQERLAAMKPGAWLINVGRGAVVDEAALVAALRERRIAGAMLDVYEHYRLPPGHPLFALDNAILTPHLAAVTIESRARMGMLAARETLRMLAGERPAGLVNPEAWESRLAAAEKKPR